MHFSFSSIVMAVMTSNIIILFIYIIFLKKGRLLHIGYKAVGVFLSFTVLRFLFPIELPITTNIYFPELLSKLIVYLLCPCYTICNISVSIFNMFEFLWLFVSLFLAYKTIKNYRLLHSYLISCCSAPSNEEECEKIIQQICKQHNQKKLIRVVAVPSITVPMVTYWKGRHIILLPESAYTSEELYYILSHEMTHIFSHDLFLKFIIQTLCIIYWWNPFCYLLRKQCNIFLEMRVDQTLTNGDHETKVAYLTCLLHVLNKDVNEPAPILGIPFCSKKNSFLLHRYSMLMETPSPNKKHTLLNLSLLSMVVLLYISSYFVIFEASYVPATIEETTEGPTEENTKIVYNNDGTYSIYFNGIFVETTDSLKHYPNNLPIYRKGELYEKK